MATIDLASIEKQAGIPLWMLKLIQNGPPEVRQITTAKQGFGIIYKEVSRAERFFILQQLIALITTLKEAKLLSLESRKYGEKLMGAVLRKWNQLGEEAVKNAVTFFDAANLLKDLPPHSHSKKTAIKKCAELMSTFGEAKFVFGNASTEPLIGRTALKAMIDFASTIPEAKETYNCCYLGDVLQIKAMRRWNQLARQALTEATTLQEIRTITKNIPADGVSMEFAARRALEIAD